MKRKTSCDFCGDSPIKKRVKAKIGIMYHHYDWTLVDEISGLVDVGCKLLEKKFGYLKKGRLKNQVK